MCRLFLAEPNRVSCALLVLAVVLPFRPHVEAGANQAQRSPVEMLDCMRGHRSFERSAAALAAEVLVPAGFEVCSVSRVPYLCEGDAARAVYTLDDAIFVLRRDDCGWEGPRGGPGAPEAPPRSLAPQRS